jgi:DNA-binding MarR family transcriptional regulator
MKIELDDREEKILNTLARRGVMSPSQVSAETWLLPGDTMAVLKSLAEAGLVQMREDGDSADGKLVALTVEAHDFLENGSVKQQISKMMKR